jgi:Ni/Fe-hydrogenase 1 B-type cytochrome subunit
MHISAKLIFVLAIFEIVTGFVLQYPEALGWLTYGVYGSEINARIIHYIITWIFIVFLIIHVYLSIRESLHEMKEMHLYQTPDE